MSGGVWGALGSIGGVIAGLLGMWATNRREGRKTSVDVAQNLIEQLQEERNTTRAELQKERDTIKAELKKEIQGLRFDIEGLQRRERVLLDYVERLRAMVPPPPPPFPVDLYRGQ